MNPSLQFKFCPRCGAPNPRIDSEKTCSCSQCGFLYYFNPAIAAAAFVVASDGKTLLIRRAKEPGRGKLALPGGFIDFKETAEQALRREILEEVNLPLATVEYLCSFPNEYFYKEVTYTVLDLFFTANTPDLKSISALDGVESYCWLDPLKFDPGDLAFPSMRSAFGVFLERFHAKTNPQPSL